MRTQITFLSATVHRLCWKVFASSAGHGRNYSSSATDSLRERLVHVPAGSSGDIKLSILEPLDTPINNRSTVVIYLPPGPLFGTPPGRQGPPTSHDSGLVAHTDLPSPQERLAQATLCTIVTIKYRLGIEKLKGKQKTYKFPTPIHDTLIGFDWVRDNLTPSRMCVYGSHVGGSLALMLALTESRSLAAVAADHPICNWAELDDYCISDLNAESKRHKSSMEEDVIGESTSSISTTGDGPQSRKRGRKSKHIVPELPDLVPLLDARKKLFPKPEKYFDSFASPTFFLRTSGKYTPLTFPTYLTGPDYPIPVLKRPYKTEADVLYMTDILSATGRTVKDGSIDMDPEEPHTSGNVVIKPVNRRKVLSRWPPYGPVAGGSAMNQETVLPNVRIYVHGNNDVAEDETDSNQSAGSVIHGEDEISSQLESLSLEDTGHVQGTKNKQLPSRGRMRDIGKITGDTVLARQGMEMVSLLRNVCFWSREKGYGEQRVKLAHSPYPSPLTSTNTMGNETALDGGSSPSQDSQAASERDLEIPQSVEERAGRFFSSIFDAQ